MLYIHNFISGDDSRYSKVCENNKEGDRNRIFKSMAAPWLFQEPKSFDLT